MRILSININDFGGLENHLMEHKKYNAWVGRECIDWKYWSAIDKDVVFNKFLNYIEDKQPDVLIVNEMIVGPLERIDFISKIRYITDIAIQTDKSIPIITSRASTAFSTCSFINFFISLPLSSLLKVYVFNIVF